MQATVHGVAKSQTWLSDFTFTLALALGSALDLLLSPVTELVVTVCCIQFTFHCTSQSDREMVHCCCVEWEDDTSKWFFFDLRSVMKHLLIELFHLSSLLQMPNNCRMVNSSVLHQLFIWLLQDQLWWWLSIVIVNSWWLATTLLIFKALVSSAKHLEPPLPCTSTSKFLGQMRCWCCKLSLRLYDPFWTEEKCSNLLSNISSIVWTKYKRNSK